MISSYFICNNKRYFLFDRKEENLSLMFCSFLFLLLAVPSFADAATAYISNEKDNTISVVDLDKMEVTDTIKVGQRPRGIILSEDEKSLYICDSEDNRIAALNLETLKVDFNLLSGPDPELLILHQDGRSLFIANEDDNLVTVTDTKERMIVEEIVVGVEPEGLGLSPDGKVLVNTSETTNMAHFIDTETLEVFENVLVDARPRVAVFNKDGTEIWVSAEVGGTVSIIDPKTFKIKSKINFKIPGVNQDSIQAVGIQLASDGKYAFVALGPSSRVAVIDQKTKKVLIYLLVGQRVWQLAFTPDEKRLISTNGVSNDISIIDIEKMKTIKSIKVGRFPWGVVIKK